MDVTIKFYAKNYAYRLIFGPVRSNLTHNTSVIRGPGPHGVSGIPKGSWFCILTAVYINLETPWGYQDNILATGS